MDAIFFVLRTGCQWNALNDTGICSSSAAHRRFQEWAEAGVPIGLAVEGANRHDFKIARETIESFPVARPAPTPDQPQGMCLDKGYDFDEVRDLLAEFGFTAHIRARGEEARALIR
jgi:transposase